VATTDGEKSMVAKYALSVLFGLGILTASAGVVAAPNYADSDTVCINACRKADSCHGLAGAHDGSRRCRKCVADCNRAQKKEK
jgi:hypothetical protein